MTFTFRVVLIVVCALTCWYTLRKIRKSQMQIEDSLFWIILSFGLAGISIFPRAAEYLAEVLGILSPANFVFLVVIFLLLMKVFTLTLKYSQLEEKLKRLVQRLTIEEGKRRGRKGSGDAVREGEKESPAAAALDSTKVKNEESTEMICGGGGAATPDCSENGFRPGNTSAPAFVERFGDRGNFRPYRYRGCAAGGRIRRRIA